MMMIMMMMTMMMMMNPERRTLQPRTPALLVCVLLLLLLAMVTERTAAYATFTPECTCVIQRQGLPDLPCNETVKGNKYPTDKEYPEAAPENLNLEGLTYEDGNGAHDMGIRITWNPPQSDRPSFTRLTGFKLSMHTTSRRVNSFFILPFPPKLRERRQPRPMWNLTCARGFRVINNEVLRINLDSLPMPPATSVITDPYRAQVHKRMNFGDSSLDDTYHWKPDILVSKKDDKIIAEIIVPPTRRRNITGFEMRRTIPNIKQNLYNLQPQEDGNWKFSFFVPVKNNCTNYTVQVYKLCTEGCPGKWECRDSTRGGVCARARLVKILDHVTLNDTCGHGDAVFVGNATLDQPPLILPLVTESYHAPQLRATIPLAAGFLLLVIIMLLFVWYWKRRAATETGRQVDPEKLPPELTKTVAALEGPPPRVLIIYSNDHPCHLAAVQAFATFLQQHCHCDVLFDEWYRREIEEDLYGWHLHQLREADKIIIVHSEAASKKFQALVRRERVVNKVAGPKVDSFQMASQILKSLPFLDCSNQYGLQKNSFVMVHFSYTPDSHVIKDISNGILYKIPDHLEELFFHLHGRAKYACGRTSTVASISAQHYHQVAAGAALRDAIEAARAFQAENPDWCSRALEVITPKPHHVTGAVEESALDRAGNNRREKPKDLNSEEGGLAGGALDNRFPIFYPPVSDDGSSMSSMDFFVHNWISNHHFTPVPELPDNDLSQCALDDDDGGGGTETSAERQGIRNLPRETSTSGTRTVDPRMNSSRGGQGGEKSADFDSGYLSRQDLFASSPSSEANTRGKQHRLRQDSDGCSEMTAGGRHGRSCSSWQSLQSLVPPESLVSTDECFSNMDFDDYHGGGEISKRF